VSKTPHQWLISFSRAGIQDLRLLPAAPSVKKLKAQDDQYRARAGDYRILFSLEAGTLEHLKAQYKGKLIVDAVRHRSRAYRP
jgi:mRNA-degrading endonuclease RelE of RelBE toxin-antitoxin system